MSISGTAILAGIVGSPVAHSLSPRMHGYWLEEHRIDGAYIPLPVVREDFASVLKSLLSAGFSGINVTVPHKEAAFALVHEAEDTARITGAVNLLAFRNGRIIGRNTDVPGLVASLTQSLGTEALHDGVVGVLGAGGAARAAVLALAMLGAREIRIVNRDRRRAEALTSAMQSFVPATIMVASWPQAAADLILLVNATSAGMLGNAPLDIVLEELPTSAAVCDIVYNPLETALLKQARTRGHKTIDGLGMLMHQAVPSFAAFFGVTPNVSPALRELLEQALHG